MPRLYKRQNHDQLVRIATWRPAERAPGRVYPVGSREKDLLICPTPAPFPFLIPGHAYLFKRPEGRFQRQIWSEVIAYELSLETGVVVPPAFMALNEETGAVGALVEFFYGAPQTAPVVFVHAADALAPTITDVKRGRPHSLQQNLICCRDLGLDSVVGWWAGTLTFDALIGNSDRHPSNWGYLEATFGQRTRTFTPAFDNGTSLGYELLTEAAIGWGEAQMSAYIARGFHHCTVTSADDCPARHLAMIGHLARTYATAPGPMLQVLNLPDSVVDETMQWVTGFAVPEPFPAARAEFLSALTKLRRDTLLARMGA